MQPGRELDALIAKHIFGYEFQPPADRDYCEHCGRVPLYWAEGSTLRKEEVCDNHCHYSTDDDAPWQVVRAMWEKGYEINLSRDDGQIDCDFREAGKEWVWASAPTLPHAVCVAALRALGVEDE